MNEQVTAAAVLSVGMQGGASISTPVRECRYIPLSLIQCIRDLKRKLHTC